MTLPEYLSGGRIQGKTTDTSGDVTTGWEMVNTLNAPNGTTGVFDFGEENNVTHLGAYDLGSAAGNAWALRFKLVMTQTDGSGGSSDANVIVALSDNETAAGDEGQDFIGMRVHNAGNNLVRPNHGDNSSPRSGQTGGNQSITIAEDTNYYIEIKRISDTSFSWRWTTNSAFTGGSSGTVSISAGTVTGLRYIKIMNVGNCTSCSTFTGYIDDLQYWADGDTTGTATHTFDFELTDESITTITNVPAGTRYEETDTRKIFRRKAGGGAAQNTNIFNLSYSTEKQAAITAADDPTGKCVDTHNASNPESRAYATLGTSGNTKTFEIKFTITRGGSDTGNNWGMWLGSDDWDDDGAGGTNKRINVRMSNGNTHIFEVADAADENTSTSLAVAGTGTTKYYTITGNGTNAKCEYWASSARSGTAESSSGDVSFPTAWLTRDAIDTVTFGGWGGGGNAINVTFSDVSIKWDSGAVDSWVEKGTA